MRQFPKLSWLALLLACLCFVGASGRQTLAQDGRLVRSTTKLQSAFASRQIREIAGWQVHIAEDLIRAFPEDTEKATKLLQAQLQEITRVVPANAVIELQKVKLYFSQQYDDASARAEYHPSAQWLRANGRDPQMAKGVEFSNIQIFEAETRRMPNFALHELAHAYHDRVLPQGFQNDQIKAAYKLAKESGIYNRVDRQDSEGRITQDRAYAIASEVEYFAESTEAYFSRNDFFPFDNAQFKRHDPEMYRLVGELWGSK